MKIEVEFHKIYSAPREYLTGDEENELQLIRERLKKKYKEEYESQDFKEKNDEKNERQCYRFS